ncbi:MAG: glycerol-3-phosphate 1-O-acyltransferase PlsY [Acholeplasmataceae bacterium]|nr:glycerol-3-phosphate 1-O-acyltransferase PlsY [Acholeplasmataceae bacterium]
MIKYLLLIIAYLIGSIPFGLIISKLKGIDIRQHGSKNIGSTNVARVLGFKYGLIVLLLDSLKGAIFVALFTLKILPNEYCLINPIIYGLAATIGHSFSIYLRFKGGKAVATTAGTLLAYDPILLVIALLVFFITVRITKYVSLGSLLGAATALILSIVFTLVDIYTNIYQYPYEKIYFPLATFALTLLILLRHRKNIEKLKKQTENKFEIK